MIIFKIVQFARLQAISESVKNEKRIDLKELPRPHKLPQSALAKSVEGGVKICKTYRHIPRRGLATLKTLSAHHW